jgi:hypothetical protein
MINRATEPAGQALDSGRAVQAGDHLQAHRPSSAQRDTLPGMASPEVARLVRRVDEQDETVRAISDTVLDIKETVDRHTETLTAIQQTQVQQGEVLAQHGELLAEILRRLSNNTSG